MRDDSARSCLLLRAGETYSGMQGFDYLAGISAETAGARGLCMHLLTVPLGGRARAHMHESHKTAMYVLEGEGEMWYGPRLEHHMAARPAT